jgi:2-C-methyl-D-erythritol 2,4-cyclodiphosphate synthase
MGMAVEVVVGDALNIKITRPEDVALAERLLISETETRTGFGYDVHAFALPEAGRKLFLGGIEIPYEQGLEGHSDADVLLHAVCDALLGAVSLGDIGILFPNTDPAYKGIASLRLLATVGERVRQAGWQPINIDVTVVAEAPKLAPYRPRIQQVIADGLGIAPERVSLKATTSEKMGFVGRREGIACWAVATLRGTPRP